MGPLDGKAKKNNHKMYDVGAEDNWPNIEYNMSGGAQGTFTNKHRTFQMWLRNGLPESRARSSSSCEVVEKGPEIMCQVIWQPSKALHLGLTSEQ